MNKIIIITILIINGLLADIGMGQIEEMVKKIHEKREGIELESLEKTPEPFVRLVKDNNVTTFLIPKKDEEKKISLYAIVNKRAYINDRWLGEGERFLGFELVYIGKHGVVLRSGNQIKKLFLHEGKSKLITLSKKGKK